MRDAIRDQLLVGLFAAAVMLPGLGTTGLWDYDEALWAGTAAEMGRRGDWIVPAFNGELSIQKPPLMYWVMLMGTRLLGEHEFAYRIGSAVFGIAACVLTYRLGRTLFDRQVGMMSGAALATATMFDAVSRGATPDGELVCFCTLALVCFVEVGVAGGWPPAGSIGRLRWQGAVPMYAAMGLAVLTKGPIGILVPTLALGLFVAIHNTLATDGAAGSWPRFFARGLAAAPGATRALRPLTALVAVAAVVGPWFALVQHQTGGEFGAGFIGTHNIQRFLQPFERHRGTVLYYVPAVLLGFFPWSMFSIPTLLETAQRIRGRLPGRPGALLLAVWFSTWVGFFSLAQTKLPNYILPAFPAAAILTAAFLVRWARDNDAGSRFWMAIALSLLAAAGVATFLVCRWLPDLPFGGTSFLSHFRLAEPVGEVLRTAAHGGWIMAATGIGCLALAARGRRWLTLAGYAVMSAAFILFLFNVAAVDADRHQPTAEVMAIVASQGGDRRPLGQWRYPVPSLVHYSGGRVEPCTDAAAIDAFLDRHPDGCVIATVDHEFPQPPVVDAVIVGECEAFPQSGRILVLARPPAGKATGDPGSAAGPTP